MLTEIKLIISNNTSKKQSVKLFDKDWYNDPNRPQHVRVEMHGERYDEFLLRIYDKSIIANGITIHPLVKKSKCKETLKVDGKDIKNIDKDSKSTVGKNSFIDMEIEPGEIVNVTIFEKDN